MLENDSDELPDLGVKFFKDFSLISHTAAGDVGFLEYPISGIYKMQKKRPFRCLACVNVFIDPLGFFLCDGTSISSEICKTSNNHY